MRRKGSQRAVPSGVVGGWERRLPSCLLPQSPIPSHLFFLTPGPTTSSPSSRKLRTLWFGTPQPIPGLSNPAANKTTPGRRRQDSRIVRLELLGEGGGVEGDGSDGCGRGRVGLDRADVLDLLSRESIQGRMCVVRSVAKEVVRGRRVDGEGCARGRVRPKSEGGGVGS